MAKKVDKAGIWKVKKNIITREGVFPYSGKVIDPTGEEYHLEPDKFYMVYRPFSEISSKKFLESLDGKPIVNGHVMLGDRRDGFTSPDTINTCGAISNIVAENGAVYGDLTIWSDTMKSEIEDGKKELSLGYLSKYRREGGEFNGMTYDFVQYGHEGNHLALVERGRMGSDVRVYDSFTTDSLEITGMEKKEEKKDVRKEISELLKGASDELIQKCKDSITEILSEKKEEKQEDENEPEKKDEKKSEDEGEKKDEGKSKDEGEGEKKSESEDEGEPEKKGDGDKKTGDSAPTMKELMRSIAERDDMYAKVSKIPEVGTFDHAEMLASDVADYACNKLGIKNVKDSVSFMNGYLANYGKKETVFTSDSSESETASSTIDDYLKQ